MEQETEIDNQAKAEPQLKLPLDQIQPEQAVGQTHDE